MQAIYQVAWIQSIFYILTGLWPLVSMNSFIRVTGPKTDVWLVKTIGLLLTVIGCVIGSSVLRKHISFETMFLAVGSASVLAAIDSLYVFMGRISKVYLIDALTEVILIVWWLIGAYMTAIPC